MRNLPKIARIERPVSAKAVLLVTLFCTILALAQSSPQDSGSSSAPRVITDPMQITSQSKLEVQPLTIEKLYLTHSIGESTWSPDGKQVAFISNISGRRNLWLVPARGGWPTQLTVSDQRQTAPAWCPSGRWIAYGSDKDGNEQWDIFLVSPSNGQVINLTNTPEISEESFAWSPDGKKLVYSVKPKEAPNYEVDVIEVLTKKVTHITSNTPQNVSNLGAIWLKDGKWIVFTQADAAGKNSNIFIANASAGKPTSLTPHRGEKNFSASDISPNGKTVLITSNAENGYDNVGLLDVATKKISWLTNERWQVVSGNFSPDGKRVTWTENQDGNINIFSHDLASRRTEKLPLAEGLNTLAGSNTAFTRNGMHLLFNHDGPDAPNDLWVYDFAAQKPRQLTHSLLAGIRSDSMVQPFLVRYPSTDKKWLISALLYVPFNAERNGKNAGVVLIHGGPTAQTVNSFNRNVQYLVNQGYFVIAPNYRGSSGYGKEFEDADRFDMGGGDLQDVIAAADWLAKTGYVDAKKIAVMGGSYGGYLTMMAVTKAPERWAAGIPIVPFVNWFTEIQNEDPLLQQYDMATMGDPMKDKARLEERSPINFVDGIKAPLLVLAGGNDPRCPRTEAEQVASAVKKHGGVVELKIYENEGHGFAKLENQIDAITRISEFLKKYDPPEQCGCNVYQ
jgi:dipeptidyl aminopeptidase/acylaminoacyl peptidase